MSEWEVKQRKKENRALKYVQMMRLFLVIPLTSYSEKFILKKKMYKEKYSLFQHAN
jgi:hypothetical protein